MKYSSCCTSMRFYATCVSRGWGMRYITSTNPSPSSHVPIGYNCLIPVMRIQLLEPDTVKQSIVDSLKYFAMKKSEASTQICTIFKVCRR